MFFPEVLTALADTMGNQSKNDTIQAFVQHQDISALDYRVGPHFSMYSHFGMESFLKRGDCWLAGDWGSVGHVPLNFGL